MKKILKDYVFLDQRDNLNPDGTSNWKTNKIYGRFNQCFISSSVMFINNIYKNMSNGYPKKNTITELDYILLILNQINNGDVSKDNKKRFNWDENLKLINNFFNNSLNKNHSEYFKFRIYPYSEQKIIYNINNNIQPIVGIWIGDYFKGAKGHVTTVVGYEYENKIEEEKMITTQIGNNVANKAFLVKHNILGYYFCDPAGDLFCEGSYNNLKVNGNCVYYSKDKFDNLFKNNRMMIGI